MKKVALFGGSFNPIHNAHLEIAKLAVSQFSLDEIWFIPSNVHPFKGKICQISNKDRLKLIEIAIEGFDSFVLKTDEIDYQLKYTYDTINHFINNNKKVEFYLMIGSDNMKQFDQWYKFKDIESLINIIVFKRLDQNGTYKIRRALELKNRLINVSSTDIRNGIKEKIEIKNMLPQKVFDYIEENKLYR